MKKINKEIKSKITELFLLKLELFGNDKNGKIETFAELGITRNYAEYIFAVPYRLEKYLQKVSGWDVPDVAVSTLTQPGKLFGFFTLGEIMKSNLWCEEISPNLKTTEDWFYSGIELLNTMGYGYYELFDFYEKENVKHLQVKLYHSLEAKLYTQWYHQSDLPKCYFSKGVLFSLATLVYALNINNPPNVLSIELYEQYINISDKISCTEDRCIAESNQKYKECNFTIKIKS